MKTCAKRSQQREKKRPKKNQPLKIPPASNEPSSDEDEREDEVLEDFIRNSFIQGDYLDQLGIHAEQVRKLKHEARAGSAEAINLLHNLAKRTTQILEELGPENEIVRSISHYEHYWPVMMPEHTKARNDPRLEYLRKLELGKCLPINTNKFLNTDTTARRMTAYAIAILQQMRGPQISTSPVVLLLTRQKLEPLGLPAFDYPDFRSLQEKAMKLEPLTLKSWRDWAEMAWQIILEATNHKPAHHEILSALGESAGKKKPKYGMKIGEKTRERNVEAKIKERLFQVFNSIVAY